MPAASRAFLHEEHGFPHRVRRALGQLLALPRGKGEILVELLGFLLQGQQLLGRRRPLLEREERQRLQCLCVKKAAGQVGLGRGSREVLQLVEIGGPLGEDFLALLVGLDFLVEVVDGGVDLPHLLAGLLADSLGAESHRPDFDALAPLGVQVCGDDLFGHIGNDDLQGALGPFHRHASGHERLARYSVTRVTRLAAGSAAPAAASDMHKPKTSHISESDDFQTGRHGMNSR